jgi:cytosine/adenosine deaminase-related metal-dependent hydrolase
MILYNVHTIAGNAADNIHIQNGLIAAINADSKKLPASQSTLHLHFTDALVFPGLINSHDHLDFNLFPPLGNRVYANYTEWGMDIHKNNFKEINAVMKVPQHIRIQWGLYKNLLNGITTVVNHGKQIKTNHDTIRVFQKCYTLHSVAFERWWKYKLNRPFAKPIPFAIHVGEGTDAAAGNEINTLLRWNLFKRKLIGIHGVAMNEKQAARFDALVWCPASNYFLLNSTAEIKTLKKHVPIVFGTDSTLTAGWNFWEQLRLARQSDLLTDKELIEAVTSTAAKAWNITGGSISVGAVADLVVAKKKQKHSTEAFFVIDPNDILLVIQQGSIQLFDAELKEQLQDEGVDISVFSAVQINGTIKYVRGNIGALINIIRTYYPDAVLPVSAA